MLRFLNVVLSPRSAAMTASTSISQNSRQFAPADSGLQRVVLDLGIRCVSELGAMLNRVCGHCERETFGILMYHRVAEPVRGVRPPTINVSPAQFRRQIKGLVEQGFVFWPLRRMLEVTARGDRIPPYVTAVTFDDGFAGVYEHAWPVLEEFRVPATIFLATAYLGTSDPFPFDHWGRECRNTVPASAYQPMTLAQCREMLASGLIEFGAHTHSHEDFRGRASEFRADLETNVAFLRDEFGISDPTFAFPYGTPRLGFASDELVDAAKAVGVRCSLTTQSTTIRAKQSPFTWGRFNAFPWDSGKTLAAKLNGWYSWAPRLKNRIFGSGQQSGIGEQGAGGREQSSNVGVYASVQSSEYSVRSTQSERAAANSEVRVPNPQSLLSGPRSLLPAPFISVVVPTFNRAAWLREALATLVRQRTDDRFEYEVVVVDNASVDDTAEVVSAMAAESAVGVRYFCQEQAGDAPTRNLGVRESDGEWLAFFDDDQLAPAGWLLNLWDAAEFTASHIVGGPIKLAVDANELKQLGPWCREALRETDLHSELHPYVRGELPGTGNALVARSVFDELGLFDEAFTHGGSDYDFFNRARAARIEQWYAPAAAIFHRVDRDRLTPQRLRKDALSGGWEHAGYFDYERHGMGKLLQGCLGRIAQAYVVHMPLLALDWLAGNDWQVLGRRVRLWRTEGYVRRTLSILSSQLFPGKGLFGSVLFRNQRQDAT